MHTPFVNKQLIKIYHFGLESYEPVLILTRITSLKPNPLTLQSLESISLGFDRYVLNANGLVERCDDPLAWLDWMRTYPRVVDANLLLNNREIVTLFAGYAGAVRNRRPCTYCTIMKPDSQKPEHAVVLQWYATRAEAEIGHQGVVYKLKA